MKQILRVFCTCLF